MGNNSVDTLIDTYKIATSDADDMIKHMEKINSIDDVREDNVPDLVYELQDKDSSRAKTYIACASITGGGVAVAIGTTLACGALTGNAPAYGISASTMALASTYGAYAGMGTALSSTLFFTLPLLTVPIIINHIRSEKLKKYRKEHKGRLVEVQENLKNTCKKVNGIIEEIEERKKEIDSEISEKLKSTFKKYQRQAKKLAKDVAIEIDDIVNTGANERILKYNEIILKQYRLQRELEEKMDYLYVEYSKLQKEKDELERKIGILIQLLNTMGCQDAVINHALSE